MAPQQLLCELGVAMNLPQLAFDGNGCARLLVDGELAVNFELDPAHEAIQLYSTIAPLPTEGGEALYLSLLEGNLFVAQTQGATLAVDSLYREVVLCRTVPTHEMDPTSFASLVERFVTAAEEWTQKLQAPPALGAASGGAGAAAAAPAAAEPRLQAHFLRV
jgi:hypothetical protein